MAKEKVESGDDIMNENNIPESAWFKFEKPGDAVQGVVDDIFEKQGQNDWPDQKIFVLRLSNGDLINVPIKKTNTYLMQSTNKVRKGDKLGFKFVKEIPPTIKGRKPAKSITPYVVYTPEGDAVREVEKF